MKRRVVFGLIGLVSVVVVLSLYVLLTVVGDLRAGRRALLLAPHRLEASQIQEARRHLERASSRFDSWPARAVGWLPLVSHNFDALEAVAERSLPVLSAADDLSAVLDQVEDAELVEDGVIDVDLLSRLEVPLRVEASALSGYARAVEEHRTGWLLPPLWSAIDDLLIRLRQMERSARNAAELIVVAPDMLGEGGERTYLVALLNNTELRGAGGILSGVGSLRVTDGRIALGEFHHYQDLADEPPYRRVPAPEDFQDHFGSYKADTTRWATTSSSPDLPDVGLVASRLFELTSGIEVDGVIFLDPRGLAALLPPNAAIEVPTTDRVLTASELPAYVYQEAYGELGGGVPRRRDSLIGLGHTAANVILERGLGGVARLRSLGEAVAGGHISMVSFDEDEQDALVHSGAARELGVPVDDAVLTTVQNIGGNKLDSYARRSVGHTCRVDGENPTRCQTEITIANRTPPGLTRFEYQYKPYGLFKNVVEIYVPAKAELTSVEGGGERLNFTLQKEDGFNAVGVYVEIPKGEEKTVTVTYELPAEGHYSLSVVPQPLVEDAQLSVALGVPAGWEVDTPDGVVGGDVVRWEGPLDKTLKFEAGPSRRTGLPSLWAAIQRFWVEPVF